VLEAVARWSVIDKVVVCHYRF